MKVQVQMKASKVKKIYKHTKKEPRIRFWYEANKNNTPKYYTHKMVSYTADNI